MECGCFGFVYAVEDTSGAMKLFLPKRYTAGTVKACAWKVRCLALWLHKNCLRLGCAATTQRIANALSRGSPRFMLPSYTPGWATPDSVGRVVVLPCLMWLPHGLPHGLSQALAGAGPPHLPVPPSLCCPITSYPFSYLPVRSPCCPGAGRGRAPGPDHWPDCTCHPGVRHA